MMGDYDVFVDGFKGSYISSKWTRKDMALKEAKKLYKDLKGKYERVGVYDNNHFPNIIWENGVYYGGVCMRIKVNEEDEIIKFISGMNGITESDVRTGIKIITDLVNRYGDDEDEIIEGIKEEADKKEHEFKGDLLQWYGENVERFKYMIDYIRDIDAENWNYEITNYSLLLSSGYYLYWYDILNQVYDKILMLRR